MDEQTDGFPGETVEAHAPGNLTRHGSRRRGPGPWRGSRPISLGPIPGIGTNPMGWGFRVTLGVLIALLLAVSLNSLAPVTFNICAALFLALALNPLVGMLQRRGISRGKAVLLIALVFGLVAGAFLAFFVPFAIRQGIALVLSIPAGLQGLATQEWVLDLNTLTNGGVESLLRTLGDAVGQSAFWGSVAGGALRLGSTLVGLVSSGVFIAVLTLYFLMSLRSMKRGFYSLVSASKRHTTIYLTEKITDSVGRYLGGMVVLAFINALFSLLLLTLTGVPFAAVISLAAFFITLIPLIGTILTTVFMTIFALISSPTAGLIVLISMLIYMQLEAYILTPKVMSKALEVPGAIVLISATAGATLMGLPGALIAVPAAAAGILIVRYIVVPQRSKQ